MEMAGGLCARSRGFGGAKRLFRLALDDKDRQRTDGCLVSDDGVQRGVEKSFVGGEGRVNGDRF